MGSSLPAAPQVALGPQATKWQCPPASPAAAIKQIMAASAAEQAPGAPGSIQPADKDGGSGQAQLRFLRPKNYTLPQECIQHELLYPPIFDLLRPYFVRGIRREDFDACVPAAPKDFNIDQGTPGQSKFRMLLWDNEVWVRAQGRSHSGVAIPVLLQASMYHALP